MHDHSFGLHLFEFAQRVVLRLERPDERVAITAERLANYIVHPFFHVMIWNLIIFFFERLDDELSIYQILQRRTPRVLDLGRKIVTGRL